MNVINRRVDELTPYANNAKKHDKRQIGNVAESIKQYGFVQPVVVDKDGVIVIGHCRVLAAKHLKMAEVPCVCVDDLTPEQIKALRLIDNKVAESDWDLELVSAELPGVDISMFDLNWEIDDDEPWVEKVQTEEDVIPESRLCGFTISAFGMNSECFIEVLLNNERADKVLRFISENGTTALCAKLIEVIDSV